MLVELNIKIINYDKEKGIILFNFPNRIKFVQNREYIRVNCNIFCTINNKIKGIINNISGGGAKIEIEGSFNFKVKEKIKLSFEINNKNIETESVILSANQNEIRIKFVNIKESLRSIIVNFTLYENLKKYKNIIK